MGDIGEPIEVETIPEPQRVTPPDPDRLPAAPEPDRPPEKAPAEPDKVPA